MDITFHEKVDGEWVERKAEYKRLTARELTKLRDYEQDVLKSDNADGILNLYASDKTTQYMKMFIECDSSVDFGNVEFHVIKELAINFTARAFGVSSE